MSTHKILISLCVMWAILGGLITHFILFPPPEVSDSRITNIDTVYVTDTVIVVPPPIVRTITEFVNVPIEPKPIPEEIIIGEVLGSPYTSAVKEFPEGRVDLRIYPMVELDSIKVKLTPTPLEVICRDMVVTVDSIEVITVTKGTSFWNKLAYIGGGIAGGILLMEFAR